MSSQRGRDYPDGIADEIFFRENSVFHLDDDDDRERPSSKRRMFSLNEDGRMPLFFSLLARPSRSYSSTDIEEKRSSSQSRTSAVPKTTRESEDDVKQRSRSFVRPILRSVVPDSQVLSPARRPIQSGQCKLISSKDFSFLRSTILVGKRIELLTNHFPIEFSRNSDSIILYQFDVDVEILMRDGSWRSCKKDERFQVMKTIIERETFPLVWYDQGKNLYAMENLTLTLKNEYQCEIVHQKTGRKNRFRFVLINLVKTYDLKEISDFIQRKIPLRPHDSVRILETLLKQVQRAEMIVINNRFYPKNQRLDDLGTDPIISYSPQ